MGEPDWETLTIDHPDNDLARAYTRHVTEKVIRNATIGRQLARLATDSGFSVPIVPPVTSVFRTAQAADKLLGIGRNTERAVAAGYLTARQARDLLEHFSGGTFLAALTLYIVVTES
jgi:hypothetical protein